MYIYAYLNESKQYSTDRRRDIPTDAIRMQGKKPSNDYVAAADGSWRLQGYTAAQSITKIETLIQKRLDDFAQTLTYSSFISACSYVSSTNKAYAIEGQYCVELRDATWDAAYAILNSMQGEISAEGKTFTEAELAALWQMIEAQLPTLAWPEGSRGYSDENII